MRTAGGDHYGSRGVGSEDPEAMIATKAKAKRPSSLDSLLADLGDGGPVTNEERRQVIEELRGKGAFTDG